MFTKCTSKSGRVFLLVILALFLLAATVIYVSLSTRVRFPEKSIICGQDVSNVLVADVQKYFDEKVHNYTMKVTVGDQLFSINAADIDLVFLNDEFTDVALASIKNDYSVDPWSVISLNRDKLYSHIFAAFDQKRTEAVPAAVAWDDSDGCFKVIDGSPETWYDAELLIEFVFDGVSRLAENLDISESILYMEVDNTEQFVDAEKLAVRANDLLKLKLEYVFNPRKVEVARHVIDGNGDNR